MDARLDENKTVLGVTVLAIAFQMLTDSNGLFDQMIEILGDFRSQTYKRGALSSSSNAPISEKTKPKLNSTIQLYNKNYITRDRMISKDSE
jgi:hypothetical protein